MSFRFLGPRSHKIISARLDQVGEHIAGKNHQTHHPCTSMVCHSAHHREEGVRRHPSLNTPPTVRSNKDTFFDGVEVLDHSAVFSTTDVTYCMKYELKPRSLCRSFLADLDDGVWRSSSDLQNCAKQMHEAFIKLCVFTCNASQSTAKTVTSQRCAERKVPPHGNGISCALSVAPPYPVSRIWETRSCVETRPRVCNNVYHPAQFDLIFLGEKDCSTTNHGVADCPLSFDGVVWNCSPPCCDIKCHVSALRVSFHEGNEDRGHVLCNITSLRTLPAE